MTPSKINFAFFWVGDDTNIPVMLVKSIRNIYKEDAYIYHLTDLSTSGISEVDKTLRSKLSEPIMLARLEAYSMLTTNIPTVFLDADSLLISKLTLPKFGEYKAFLIKRDFTEVTINHNYPEFYPEFIGGN